MLGEIACKRIVPAFYNCMGQALLIVHLDYVLFIMLLISNVTSKTDGKQKHKLIISATLLPNTIIFNQYNHLAQYETAADNNTPKKKADNTDVQQIV